MNPQLLCGNGTHVTVTLGASPPAGGSPVPDHPNTYRIPGTFLGVQNYATQFRAENRPMPWPPGALLCRDVAAELSPLAA
jgi:hypothetical protein